MLNRLFASFSCFQYSFSLSKKRRPQPRLLFFMQASADSFIGPQKPAIPALFTICFPTIYNLFSDHSPIIQKPALL